MAAFDDETYSNLYALYERECKRVEIYKNRNLTKNAKKLIEYRECLTKTYNDLLNYLNPIATAATGTDKVGIENRIVTLFKRLKECFHLLNLDYPYDSNVGTLIDLSKIAEARSSHETSESDSDSSIASGDTVKKGKKNEHTQKYTKSSNKNQKHRTKHSSRKMNRRTNFYEPRESSSSSENFEDEQTVKQLMQLATSTINYRYDGDPLKLSSFIDAIELLKDLCEEQNERILVRFLMTRLEGKAREAIIEDPYDPDDIITQLRAAIKNESSKVIEGRMLALNLDRMNLTKFAERAEALAEQYRRSLCDEGFSKAKAKELTVEKTVELCRKNTKTDNVFVLLGARPFHDPKEVIAKMITETNAEKTLRRTSNNNHNKNGNGNGNSNRKFQKQNGQNSSNNSNNGRHSNNKHNGSGNGNGNRQNWNNSGNKQGQNSHGSRTYTNSNYKRQNDQNVRLISGNEVAPGNGGQTSEQQHQ